MGTQIQLVSESVMATLMDAGVTRSGKCFENCVIAVLGLQASPKLQYVLGFVIPPGYSSLAHAWLRQETHDGYVYFDPTLQASSPLWNKRKEEFVYEERYSFTSQQLLKWFQNKYPERKYTELGIPEGSIHGPVISANGEIT